MSGALAAVSAARRGLLIALANQTLLDAAVDPGDADCAYTLENDGDVMNFRLSDSDVDLGDWMTPKDGAPESDYEARVTLVSGTLTAGTINTWLGLGATRSWSVNRATLGTKTCTFTIEIRLASSGVVLASATITIEATVES